MQGFASRGRAWGWLGVALLKAQDRSAGEVSPKLTYTRARQIKSHKFSDLG